jgi:DNA-binding protein HU-beta
MNKRDLIDALSGRLGDKKSATEALNAVLETIQAAVASGDKVAITGFGVFEKSERPARTARNPATGAEIQVAATSVPKFRPGADFKALVNGEGEKAAAKPAAKAATTRKK